MILSDIINSLDNLIPKTLSEEWDNDGVMLALDKGREITKCVVTLDLTPDCVEFAKKNGANLIITHHPFIFKPLTSLDECLKTKMIAELIKADISVLSYHTRFDNSTGGMNDALASALELENTKPLCEMARIGDLPDSCSSEEFAAYVCEKLSTDVVLYNAQNTVSRVAVLGGGGKDFVAPARLAGADAIVTGDLAHGIIMNEVFEGITVVDAGHYGTEKIFTRAILPFLEKAGMDMSTVLKFEGSEPRKFVCKEI
jgi:dinuclear metal center YbgI/SA1388 family protein